MDTKCLNLLDRAENGDNGHIAIDANRLVLLDRLDNGESDDTPDDDLAF